MTRERCGELEEAEDDFSSSFKIDLHLLFNLGKYVTTLSTTAYYFIYIYIYIYHNITFHMLEIIEIIYKTD